MMSGCDLHPMGQRETLVTLMHAIHYKYHLKKNHR